MSDHLINALQSGILVYSWRQNLEKELADVLNMGNKGNVIMNETMTPGSLAESFEETIKSYQAYNDEDNNEPEKIDESEDPAKLAEIRTKKLHILYFNFVACKSLQEIYQKVKSKSFVAYQMHAPTESS